MSEPVPWCRRGSTAVRRPFLSNCRLHRPRGLVTSPGGRVLSQDAWLAVSNLAVCPVAVVLQIAVCRCSTTAAETASFLASRSTPATSHPHQAFHHRQPSSTHH